MSGAPDDRMARIFSVVSHRMKVPVWVASNTMVAVVESEGGGLLPPLLVEVCFCSSFFLHEKAITPMSIASSTRESCFMAIFCWLVSWLQGLAASPAGIYSPPEAA